MGIPRRWRFALVLTAAAALLTVALPAPASTDNGRSNAPTVRFATFNASLNRFSEGALAAELSVPGSAQPDAVAEIIQRTRPEVLLVNEFDYDAGGVAAREFQDNYLGVGHNGADPIVYPYRMAVASNTGIPSGRDLDKNGSIGGPGDAYGFGFFPGQFAFVVYSKYPIVEDQVRNFQLFLWKDMPGALLPVNPDGTSFYDEGDLEIFRLSSKNHTDLPIEIGNKTVHFLVSHPTPPVFDGPEDRNGTRNHDEIRFWADYVSPGSNGYIYDDAGGTGGLQPGSLFVIAGDENADPFDGDSTADAIQQLLENPRINTKVTPASPGGVDRAAAQPGNEDHVGDPAEDTADFSEPPFGPGNLRADYVLPSKSLQIRDAGVFWPADDDPLSRLTGTGIFGDPNRQPSSDHRLVWLDLSHGGFPKG
ncbi:MAG: endonuclease/exonuclease/phosphatase family protein [Actinomycetota bacterium]|nr:endonuclease/exonuclease/phosphatase family protein [Actinomycetota bacterium]